MSVWVLHVARATEALTQQSSLPLPFGELPDLSKMAMQDHAKQLLKQRSPDDAPETLHKHASTLWSQFSALQKENLIAVPMQQSKQVRVAEVTGGYFYDADAPEGEKHRCEVKWYEKSLPFIKFRSDRIITQPQPGVVFAEVTDVTLRTLLRSAVPAKYNRFAGFKWLLVVALALQLAGMIIAYIRKS